MLLCSLPEPPHTFRKQRDTHTHDKEHWNQQEPRKSLSRTEKRTKKNICESPGLPKNCFPHRGGSGCARRDFFHAEEHGKVHG